MKPRVLFCNIAYMKYYRGISPDDFPINGGSYVQEQGKAEEAFNFLSDGRIVRGFVETMHRNGEPNQIHIENIDSDYADADQIDGVTVFFCATSPDGRHLLIGWYKNATVFRYRQYREYRGESRQFNLLAKSSDAVLLEEDKRTTDIPRGKDGMGQCPIWYAANAPDTIEKALACIQAYDNEMTEQIAADAAYLEAIKTADYLSETERETLAKARICQGRFRKQLLARDGVCRICGVCNEKLLVASHIKPWAKCNDQEKRDSENGLLLCAIHDALFDKGLISFADDGKLLVSCRLCSSDKHILALPESFTLEMSDKMRKYMEYHRGDGLSENRDFV